MAPRQIASGVLFPDGLLDVVGAADGTAGVASWRGRMRVLVTGGAGFIGSHVTPASAVKSDKQPYQEGACWVGGPGSCTDPPQQRSEFVFPLRVCVRDLMLTP